MKKTFRLILLGLMTWVIPFLAAFFFIDKSGQVVIDNYLFKSIMIIIGSLTGAFAIVLFFKKIQENYLKFGIIAGVTWFSLNIVLDILILLPMSNMGMKEYFFQIGLRYFVIPVMSIMCGYLLKTRV